jgi:hypothetical protein
LFFVVIAALLGLIGLLMVIGAITHINREAEDFNSPFLWAFLFAGLVLAGFGLVAVLLLVTQH